MKKIYYVIIKGRTLESRDLKELLARAVSEKRKRDRKSQFQGALHGQAPVQNALSPCAAAEQTAML